MWPSWFYWIFGAGLGAVNALIALNESNWYAATGWGVAVGWAMVCALTRHENAR